MMDRRPREVGALVDMSGAIFEYERGKAPGAGDFLSLRRLAPFTLFFSGSGPIRIVFHACPRFS
jgi:hypothetical protein